MDLNTYTFLTRQSGLMKEMAFVANNIANVATNGFRQQTLLFSEFLSPVNEGASLSMANGNIERTSFQQGAFEKSGNLLDFAIEGEGFFLLETPFGTRLTRAGQFSPNDAGDLVNMDGHRILDISGAPIFIPPQINAVNVANDGIFSIDGQILGQIGIVRPANMSDLKREGGVLFRTDGEILPVDTPRLLQGYLEKSNTDPLGQMARMIEVQRAYETGQSFLDAEDKRVKSALQSLTK